MFEVGLSWSVAWEADAFRRYRGFDVAKVAAMTAGDVERLVGDASIIRNRARSGDGRQPRAMLSASPSLRRSRSQITRKRAPGRVADLLTSTLQAEAFAKQPKSQVPLRGADERVPFIQNVGLAAGASPVDLAAVTRC